MQLEITGARRTRNREYIKTAHGRAVKLRSDARYRARRKGQEFDVPVERIEAALETGVCELTGLPFDLDTSEQWDKHPSAPSLDRIDSSKGYTLDNVQVVCYAINVLRHQYPEHLTRVYAKAFLKSTRGKTL